MDYLETLEHWQTLHQQIKHLQAQERNLREGLFNGTFPEPEEGMNEFTLPDGRVVKGTYKLNRTLDDEKLEALVKSRKVTAKVAEKIRRTSINLDMAGYRELTDKQRAAVDEAIESKPGLPTLEVTGAPVPEGTTTERGPDDPF